MKIKDIVQENADATTSSSSNIATVDTPLFHQTIKRNPTKRNMLIALVMINIT